MWDRYNVEMRVNRLTGGIPANPELLKAWLKANEVPTNLRAAVPATAPAEVRDAVPVDVVEDLAAMVGELDPEETHATIFYRDASGKPGYESRCFKAALKEAANILKGMLSEKNFRSKLAERVFVGPPLCLINTPIQRTEKPISVMTMRGPRTSLKRYEFTERVPLSFQLLVLQDGVIREDHLREMLEYLKLGGIGADRSQGSGTFELLDFSKLPGY